LRLSSCIFISTLYYKRGILQSKHLTLTSNHHSQVHFHAFIKVLFTIAKAVFAYSFDKSTYKMRSVTFFSYIHIHTRFLHTWQRLTRFLNCPALRVCDTGRENWLSLSMVANQKLNVLAK